MKAKNSITALKKPGRKSEVTLEQVIIAAERLKQESRDITGWTLRDVIGYGGPSNLISIWEQYQLDNGMANDEVEVQSDVYILPAELEGKINILLSDVSQQINNFAIESDTLANQVATKKARAAYDTMMSTNKKLVEEQELANRMIEDCDVQQEENNMMIETLEQKLNTQISLHEELKAKLAKSEDDHLRTKSMLSEEQSKTSKLTEKCSVLEKSEIKLSTKVEVAVSDKKDAIKKSETLHSKLAELSIKYDYCEGELTEKNKRLTQLEAQLK